MILYARGVADAILEGRANAVTEVVKAVAGKDEFVEVAEGAAAYILRSPKRRKN